MKVRTTTAWTAGDPNAPKGSKPWAEYVALKIYGSLRSTEADIDILEQWIEMFRRESAFQHITGPDGEAFESFEDFCLARYPYGLGYSRDAIDRIIGERRAAQSKDRVKAAAEAATSEVLPRGQPKVMSNCDITSQGERAAENGVSRYTAWKHARLARERPDLLEDVRAGRMSTHAAAVAAGIVRQPSPLEKAQRAFERLEGEERAAFIAWAGERAVAPPP